MRAMNEQTIAAQALLKLTNEWVERTAQTVHALVHSGEDIQGVRDAIIFCCGTFVGQLCALHIPLEAVDAAAAHFFHSCEQAMRTHLPSYEPQTPWPRMSRLN